MIGLVIEISMDDGENVIPEGPGFIRIHDAIRKTPMRYFPNLQPPNVVANFPELNPLADMVGGGMVCAEAVIQQGSNDFRIMFRLLEQRRNLPGRPLVGHHQLPQIGGSITMNRQGWNDTRLGITRQVMVGENAFASIATAMREKASFLFMSLTDSWFRLIACCGAVQGNHLMTEH
jgi:hypothetical protein